MSEYPNTEERFRYYEVKIVALADGYCLYRSPMTGEITIAEAKVARTALLCGQFASIRDHAARIGGEAPGRRQAVEQDLLRAAASGLLVSLSEVRDRVSRGTAAPGHGNPLIERIGISTCDRPEAVSRLLRELETTLRQSGRKPEVILVDDSRSAESIAANRAAASAFASQSGMAVRYGNRESRAQFSRAVAKECGVPESTAAFAFTGGDDLPFTAGACRNSILADGFGHHVLFMDDDVLPRFVPVPGADERTAFGIPPGSFAQRFFSSREELDAVEPSAGDLIGLHEGLFNVTTSDAGMADASLSLLKCLEKSPRAVVSLMGVWGDPGFDHPLPYFDSNPGSLAAMLQSSGGFDGAMRNRLVIRGQRTHAVTDSIGCMAYCMGVDNTEILPPFLPALRAEEMAWSRLVRGCVPGALFAVMPWAIRHDPLGERKFADDAAMANAGRFVAGELIGFLIGGLLRDSVQGMGAVAGSTRAARIHSAGARLEELAGLESGDFRGAIRQAADGGCGKTVQRLDHVVRGPGPEGTWRGELGRVRDAALEAWKRGEHAIPSDLERICGKDAAMGRLQQLVGDFARVLRAWPEMLVAAQKFL